MKRKDWDARYSQDGLVWGRRPNSFVAAETGTLPPGRALDLACGEGRNAIWLAERGWEVTGVDFSDAAIATARHRAQERGVSVDLRVDDVLTTPLEPGAYDLVLVAYLQLPEGERSTLLERAAAAVAPGGTFLLVAHDLRNLAEGHGGPTSPAVLWTVAEIVDALTARGLVIERGEEVLRHVDGAPRPAIDTLVRARRAVEAGSTAG